MCQIKAPIAGNSTAIAKIGNAELAHFTKQMLIHELIRGSLSYQICEKSDASDSHRRRYQYPAANRRTFEV
jgi:hypothetical protein